jgi:hypothetical protein
MKITKRRKPLSRFTQNDFGPKLCGLWEAFDEASRECIRFVGHRETAVARWGEEGRAQGVAELRRAEMATLKALENALKSRGFKGDEMNEAINRLEQLQNKSLIEINLRKSYQARRNSQKPSKTAL